MVKISIQLKHKYKFYLLKVFHVFMARIIIKKFNIFNKSLFKKLERCNYACTDAHDLCSSCYLGHIVNTNLHHFGVLMALNKVHFLLVSESISIINYKNQ